MNSWPVDERKQKPTDTTKEKGKKKAKDTDTEHGFARGPGYPELELGGNLLGLTEKDNRLQWTSAMKLRQDYKPLRVYKSGILFPSTRPPQTVQVQPSVRHRAEQGANFLRTFLPDLDVSSELIRDQLSDDAKYKRESERFDPDVGNLVDFLPMSEEEDPDLYGFLTFPMGELARELNVSRVLDSDDGGILEFNPSALPVKTYQTPIRQISTSKATTFNSLLAIRTFGQLHVEEMHLGRTHSTPPSLKEVAAISHYQTGNKGLVDFTFAPSSPSALAVNEYGALYGLGFSAGQEACVVQKLSEPVESQETDGFWRVAPLQDEYLYLRLSSHSVQQLDARSKDISDLLSISRTSELFTSIDKYVESDLARVCSTKNLFWLDRRVPGKPVFSYKHSREYDRTLEIWSAPWPSGPTLLTSKRNQLITVYDVSRAEGNPAQLASSASSFFSSPSSIKPTVGHVLLGHGSFDDSCTSASFVSLSECGALRHADFGLPDEEGICIMEPTWSSKVKALDKHPPKSKPLPYEEREHTDVNLNKAYNILFNSWLAEREKQEEEDAEALYELVENFPRNLQQSEVPTDHMITTYDAVLLSDDDPVKPGRTDFLTESSINSARGYRALEQGRLSTEGLANITGWHHDLLPTMRQFDPDATDDLSARFQSLCKYNLAEDGDRSFTSTQNEKIASEQLALDLTLSNHIYSLQGFAKQDEGDTGLENMTQTLSLAAGPPPVKFGYFRPVRQRVDGTPIDDFGSPGVRALLNNWKTGADPNEAISMDHNDQRPQSPEIKEPVVRQRDRAMPATQPTRPPVIVASQPAKPPPIVAAQPRELMVGSQRVIGEDASRASQSQPSQEFASTQILPGVHGGRPHQAKKKAAKKRLGGF